MIFFSLLVAVMIPPTKPQITRLSDESVMVRWSVPQNDGLPIQFFKVQYKELGNGHNRGGKVNHDFLNLSC